MSKPCKLSLNGRTINALLDLREHLTEREIVAACRTLALDKIRERTMRRIERRVMKREERRCFRKQPLTR